MYPVRGTFAVQYGMLRQQGKLGPLVFDILANPPVSERPDSEHVSPSCNVCPDSEGVSPTS